MLWILFLGLFLVCAGMSLVFALYLCLLWYAAIRSPTAAAAAGAAAADAEAAAPGEKGLTEAELGRLGGAGDGASVGEGGAECAVCLDDIEAGQAARVLPGCRHAFHRSCADRWLASHPLCPLCRARLLPPPPPPPITDAPSD
uniref:RING-type domain-containing protein n=1 Tax=Ananas comosus var. bracteatus TaxID=296719 RepID=A0A6V7PWF2_ANACO|nr:unnamed protein product [Ananas comosus var. bracteatus]